MTENARSVTEVDPRSLTEMRDALIAITADLADALTAAGDRERLRTLFDLYWTTAEALKERGWRGR
jgi:hypothetical protein